LIIPQERKVGDLVHTSIMGVSRLGAAGIEPLLNLVHNEST
jgi:hypothetical protein